VSWMLDTDVMSQPAKKRGNSHVISWLGEHGDGYYTSTVVLAQLAYWARRLDGRHRSVVERWLTDFKESMEGRILSFNISVAHIWADQKGVMAQRGHSMPVEDSYIAATARWHGLTIVTGNVRDFRHCGVKVLNPFKA
jgi:predicted nucleic acid-binding protein